MGDISEALGGQAFDTSSVPPATGFGALPAGWYPVQIDAAQIKPTKAGNGKYLKLTLTVIGEHFIGRKVFPNINLQNPNAKAVEIGVRELAALGLACGLQTISATTELLGKQIDARLKVRKGKGDYEDDNEVSAYAALGSESSKASPAAAPTRPPQPAWSPPTAPAAPAAAPPAAQQGAPKLPWER